MNRRPASTLQHLHADTGLPKSTIHRLLEDLIDAGFATRDEVKSLYRLTRRVLDLSDGFGAGCLLTDIGSEVLRRVTGKIGWPLAIGAREGLEIVVRYSTMPYSALATMPTTTANRHPLLTSAMGTAFLAFCAPVERAKLLAALRDADALPACEEAAIGRLLQRVVERGYGLRLAKRRSQGSSIAVPVFAERRLIGVVSMTVFAALLDEVLDRFLGVLTATAAEISRRLVGTMTARHASGWKCDRFEPGC
jgi:IclR family mhp operon transcriptional activator